MPNLLIVLCMIYVSVRPVLHSIYMRLLLGGQLAAVHHLISPLGPLDPRLLAFETPRLATCELSVFDAPDDALLLRPLPVIDNRRPFRLLRLDLGLGHGSSRNRKQPGEGCD